MEKEINNNNPKMPTTLAGLLNIGKIGAERKFNIPNEHRLRFLKYEICVRNGGAVALSKDQIISSQYIIQQMAYNYGQLMRETTESMNCIFTKVDMMILLSINCSPIWQKNVFKTAFEMVLEYYETESAEEKLFNTETSNLLEKLNALNFIENLTLIDICEQFWRNQRPGTLEENLRHLNLILS